MKPGTVILHSKADETVPFADSEELVRNSGLPESALIVVGHEHRLADPESLAAMLEAVETAVPGGKARVTPDQETLLDFLRNSQPTPAAKALLKRTMQQFVLDYGWWYEPAELPNHVPLGTPQQCHKNAIDLALADDSLVYCEGYALLKGSSLPIIHAWVTDGHGKAIDNTWPQPGVAYAGVPFRAGFVTLDCVEERRDRQPHVQPDGCALGNWWPWTAAEGLPPRRQSTQHRLHRSPNLPCTPRLVSGKELPWPNPEDLDPNFLPICQRHKVVPAGFWYIED